MLFFLPIASERNPPNKAPTGLRNPKDEAKENGSLNKYIWVFKKVRKLKNTNKISYDL